MPPASPSWTIYHRTSDLPLNKFIPCICEGDLSFLIIEGHPPAQALIEAWETILADWEEKMQDDTYSEIADLMKDINLLETRFNVIQTIVRLLDFMPVPFVIEEMAPELRKWLGFPVYLDLNDMTSYYQALEGALGHGKRYWTEAQDMRTQLPPEETNKVKITRVYFDEVIVSLSRYNKYKISKADTTVGEFTAMVRDMRRGIAAADKIKNN